MNTNGFAGIFAFAILSALSRFGFVWLLRMSYYTAGKTIRDVEKHNDEVKRKLIPYEKEIVWLARISDKPILAKFLYIAYYALCSIGVAGLALSLVNLFVPQLDFLISKFAFSLLALCIISAVIGAIVNNIIGNKK